jgi:general secretion pathway protein J
MTRRAAGFTLVEVVVAMALLATIMVLLYAGLTYALRSWDAGDANGRKVADRRLGENFIRREVMELFPLRWKDATQLRFAFEGDKDHVKFVSSRPAGLAAAGLSLVGIEVMERDRVRNLVMRRAMPDDDQIDFSPLEKAEATLLVANVENVSFSYFGAENDFAEATWMDKWDLPASMPLLIRMRVKMHDGRVLPEQTIRVVLGPEAGCLESEFQRFCRPRRPGGA